MSKKLEQKRSGSINFYSSELQDLTTNNVTLQKRVKSPSVCRTSRAASTTSSLGNTLQIKDWINQKSLQRLRDRHSAETHDTRQMYNNVLSNEQNFVKGIDEFVAEQDLLGIRKKEVLYKTWQENVYIPLRRQIEHKIETGFSKIDEKRRKEYLNYLQYSNRKGEVFLDVLAEDEYNPLVIYGPGSKVSLQAKTPKLKDPLLICKRRSYSEKEFLHRCQTGRKLPNYDCDAQRLPCPPLVPLGRHGTTCHTWMSMPLRDIESPIRRQSRNRMSGNFTQSGIDFEEWSNSVYGQETFDKELKIQKKRRFELPSTMASYDILRSIEMPKTHHVRFNSEPEVVPISS